MKKLNLLTLSLLVSSAITSVAQAQTIDYGMMESIFNEPVTASATGKPQRASDAPVSMSIIGSEEIRRSGAKDIPQILRRIAGVQVQSAFNGQKDVSIRGYNKPFANRILVLVNGRQVLSDAFGYTNWNSLSIGMDEIRQIEVVKGPNTSLFGFNAESGVVNIITFSPMADNKSQASVKVGTQEHKEINLTHTARFDKHAVRVSVGERDADGFSRDSMTGYGTAISSVDKEHSNDWVGRRVNVDHEWQINDSSSLRTQIGHNANLTQRLIPFAAHSRSVNDTDFVQLSYALQSDIGLWNANLYNMSNDSHAETTDSENDLLVAKVDNLFKVGTNHSIRVAAEYRDNQISGGIIGGEDATFGMSLLAPSVMWDWKVSDAWNITNSVRYDHADYARNADATFGPYASQDMFDRTIEEFS
ncbi:MAG: outer membrane receptor for ferrienterochelin and colicins, partial [bacterium]